MKLNQKQISSYHNDGYLIIKDLFTKVEIDKLQKETVKFDNIKSLPNVICESNGEIRSIFAPHKKSIFFADLYKQERLVKPVEQLLKAKVYLYQFKLNNKKAFDGEFWEWHQDFPYWHLDDGVRLPNLISVMILFQDTSLIQGPLIIVPGSHQEGIVEFEYKKHLLERYKSEEIDILNSLNNDLKYTIDKKILTNWVKKEGVVVCNNTVGTCIFFHPNLFHASNFNISPFDRNTAIITYNEPVVHYDLK